MRPDADYIKGLLTAFQDFPEPTMNVFDLEKAGYSCEKKEFYFHMKLLNDQGVVMRDDEEPGIGTTQSIDGHMSWAAIPLRLTASGHDFADALNSNAGWKAVKKSAISTSLSMMKELAVAAFKAEMLGHLPH